MAHAASLINDTPRSFIVCNFIVMRRLHSLGKGRGHRMQPLEKRLTIFAIALVGLALLINFAACIAAAVTNGKM